MARGIRDIASLLVLLAAAAQFIAFFTWTDMGTVIAISGSSLLEAAGLPLPVLFFSVVAIVAVLNLFLTSGSALYTLVAPVIVPMFMYLGVNPETTQMLYRIGDSAFNIITPLNAFFALTLGVVQQAPASRDRHADVPAAAVRDLDPGGVVPVLPAVVEPRDPAGSGSAGGLSPAHPIGGAR